MNSRNYFIILESSHPSGRYTIAAWNPKKIFSSNTENVFDFLEKEISLHPATSSPLPFVGGWLGYIGYEAYSFLNNKIPERTPDLIPKAFFGFYENAWVYDHELKKGYQIIDGKVSTEQPEGNSFELLRKPFASKLDCTGLNVAGSPRSSPEFPSGCSDLSNFSKEDYLKSVEHIKLYIHAGDVYQVNFAQRFSKKTNTSPWNLYQNLKAVHPSPYSAFMDLGDAQILSLSPELFLEVNENQVRTRPIKGTRPRGKTVEEDELLKKELFESVKDQAELLMITDLERNDLGRVCEAGSIVVPQLSSLETYAHVHHLTSTIEGKLQKNKNIVHLLRATFPGGSITGAPKQRSMQIIHELENTPRNVYCGAIGYISLNQKSAFNIAIRTAVVKNDVAYFWGGGGIVADSDPEKEYEETLTKTKVFRELL